MLQLRREDPDNWNGQTHKTRCVRNQTRVT